MTARTKRRRHFSSAGLAYIVVVALLGLGALNSQNNMLFFAFGVALAAALVSGVVSGGMLLALDVRRLAPRAGVVNVPLHVGYTVVNRSRWMPVFAVGLAEAKDHAGRSAPPPARAFVAHAAPRSETRVDAIVVPAQRGVLTFGAVRARTSFPFGITRKSVTFQTGPDLPVARCLIRPEPAPVLRDAMRRAAASSHEGETSSAAVGAGDEFYALREYVPGDSVRSIAWRSSARTGRLVVRENAAHSPQRLWVAIVPAPRAVHDAGRLNERAISLAAGLILRAAEEGAEVGLSVPAAGLTLGPRQGARHVERLLDALALLDVSDAPASARFPPASSRSAAWIVVHALETRPARAPQRAVFASAARPEGWLDASRLEGSVTWR